MPDDAEHLTRKQKQEERITERVIERIKPFLHQDETPQEPSLGRLFRFMDSMKRITASALLAAALGSIYEYLALAGVVDMYPARVVLGCAVFFAFLFVWEIVSTLKWRSRIRGFTITGITILLIAGAFLLDKGVRSWQASHPTEIAALTTEVRGISASINRITDKSGTSHIQEEVIKEKDIKPVPGYLKRLYRYIQLPMEQIGLPLTFDVFYVNEGSTYTHNSSMKVGLFYVDFHGMLGPKIHDQGIENEIQNAVINLPFEGTNDIAPGAGVWSTLKTTSPMTQQMVEDMQNGTARIYFGARVEWKTNGLADHDYVCQWLQPATWGMRPGGDSLKDEPVWHMC